MTWTWYQLLRTYEQEFLGMVNTSAANILHHFLTLVLVSFFFFFFFSRITMKSKFEVKSIAGNIIPAIATTNAIAAGLQVLLAIQILKGADIPRDCRYVWITRSPNRLGHHLCDASIPRPNPKCFSCNQTTVHCHVDTNKMTLRDFFDKVCK